MEKTTKYRLARYYPDSSYSKLEDVEKVDLYSVEDDGRMSGFCFDRTDTYVWDDYWSKWCGSETGYVWFGKRYTYEELLEYSKKMPLKDKLMELRQACNSNPTTQQMLQYMKENNITSIIMDRFHGFHEIGLSDMTYDELMEKKGKELQKHLDEIMKTIPTIQVEGTGRKY